MHSSVDIQGSPQRAKGQMGIESYFKSPKAMSSKNVEEKDNLLGYVKKVPGILGIKTQIETEPQDNPACVETSEILAKASIHKEGEDNKGCDVNENVPKNNKKKRNGIRRKNSKGNKGEKIEKLNDNVEVPVDDNTVVPVEMCEEQNPSIESTNLEATHPEIKESDVSKLNKIQEQSQLGKTHSETSLNGDLKLPELSKKEKNIFAFMMASRGNQNGLDEMTDQEECTKIKNPTADKIPIQSSCKNKELVEILIEINVDGDPSTEANACGLIAVSDDGGGVNNDAQVLKECKSLSHVSGNVFAFMMANRQKQEKLLAKNENSQEDSAGLVPDAHPKGQEKGKQNALADPDTSGKGKVVTRKRKHKKDDLDDSLRDFDLSPDKSIKKTRKRLKKSKNASEQTIKKQTDQEMLHDELETSTREDTSTNSNPVLTVLDSTGYTEKTYCVDSNELEIAPSCISVSFADYIKEASERLGDNNMKDVINAKDSGMESETRQLVAKDINHKPDNNIIDKPKKMKKGKDEIIDNTENIHIKKNKKKNLSTDTQNIPQGNSKTQVVGKRQRRKLRKRVQCTLDSDDDFEVSEVTTVSCEKRKDRRRQRHPPDTTEETGNSCTLEGVLVEPSKKNISNFFQKLSQKEKAAERQRNIFTVKADVHAPYDGPKAKATVESKGVESSDCDRHQLKTTVVDKENVIENCTEGSNRRLSKRLKKKQEIEDLNKIELLEQITIAVSPKKRQGNSLTIDVITVTEEQQNQSGQESGASGSRGESDTAACKEKKKIKNALDTTPRKVLKTSQDQNVIKVNNSDVSDSGLVSENNVKRRLRLSSSKKREKLLHSDIITKVENSGEESVMRRSLRQKKPKLLGLEGETSSKTSTTKSLKTSQIQISDESSPSAESNCDISSGSLLETDVTGIEYSSPELNEGDKENSIVYTSTFIHKSDKLRLRIKRINTGKTKSLNVKQNSQLQKNSAQKKAKKLLQKAKGPKNSPKTKKLRGKKKKAVLVNAADGASKENVVLVNMAMVEPDLVVVEHSPPKNTKKKKSTQALLKPLRLSTAPSKQNLKKGKPASQNSKKKIKKVTATNDRTTNNTKKTIKEQKHAENKKINKNNKKQMPAKETKLAPIFCKKPKSPPCIEVVKVVSLSPAKLKARRDFLKSGIPDELKKQVSTERSQEEELNNWSLFPKVSHVQQKSEDEAMWSLTVPEIPLRDVDFGGHDLGVRLDKPIYEYGIMSLLEKPDCISRTFRVHVPTLDLPDIVSVLAIMKHENPKFPVYRVFKSYHSMKRDAVESYKKELEKEEISLVVLDDDEDMKVKRKRKRKGRNLGLSKSKRSKLGGKRAVAEVTEEKPTIPPWQERTPHSWTQIFAPKSGKQVIGNRGHVKQLRTWLQEWKRKSQVDANKEKKKKKKISRKGDNFVKSDESSSWDEEDDSVNTYLLSGPPGIGKTSTVYALAAELGYKVLEVNASSRRPGRQVMSQLAEATQSHSVSSSSSAHPLSTVASMFAAKMSGSTLGAVKKAMPSSLKDATQGSGKDVEKRKDVSLVLFEDIDIVFEEWDEGFISAVNSFIATTKRPIILTVSHSSPAVLSRIKGRYEKINFVTPPEGIIAHHLQLLCLANGYHVCYKDLESLVHINKGDIRQSFLDLQLLAVSGSSHDTCRCGTSEMMNVSSTECDNILEGSKRKDLSIVDIFPEATNIELHNVRLFTAGFCGKIQAKAAIDDRIFDLRQVGSDSVPKIRGDISWTQIANNLSFILPFPLREKEKKVPVYPLQPHDPKLKTTPLWQRNSWLSLHDEEEEEEFTQPETVEKEEEPVEEIKVPPIVQNASKLSLNSLVNLYDTFTQLDILESSQQLSHNRTQIKECGWWVQQPTAGLSEDPRNPHPHWTSYDNINNITQELGQRALIQCNGEISSILTAVTPEDWPQLCLISDSNCRMPSLLPHFSPNDRSMTLCPWIIVLIFTDVPNYLPSNLVSALNPNYYGIRNLILS
ncbi:ATPase family AAA domain-containing protein 5-like isoform X2 [Homarus americanus]|uniref:ATPase family AAA domain-containing protein 5-like isoform X2 n=1 Tax=Homarus americanus TaxID=6706 RepID=UPI001C4380C2|nr:ATPase family AAA domain-containing protein 5-like isoform X2 [Homarus americanus]